MVACGLDDFVYLEPPVADRIQRSDSEYEQFISFRTSDVANLSLGFYKGFDVFYKIYATKELCEADITAIENYNSSNPYSVARYVRDTKKYGLLGRRDGKKPLVEAASTDRLVKIRLYDYGTEKAGLYIDDALLVEVCRENNEAFAILPKDATATDGQDIQLQTAPKDGEADPRVEYKYVAFFAVTSGMDTNLSPLYSSVSSLGWLELQPSSEP